MKNRLCCNPLQRPPASKLVRGALLFGALWILACTAAFAGDAPQWMRTAAAAPLPAYDERTDAVLLYSDEVLTVVGPDKFKTQVRRVFKILRPDGHHYGVAIMRVSPHEKVTHVHGWCIPAQGAVYEVKDKDSIETSLPNIAGSELISDVRVRLLEVPAASPGNIVGYEYEIEEQPFALQDVWEFQRSIPVVESHYSLQLPAGWEYKNSWINSSEIQPTQSGGVSQWSVSNVQAVRSEQQMPALDGVSGQMVVSFFPPGGSPNTITNWEAMGTWYLNLTAGRRDPSPELQQKVALLTAGAASPVDKMRRIAGFVQSDIRYVAIVLGIGGLQPHSASEVFAHRYGDCKDKATLMGAMLHEVGIESYYVLINTDRGAVTANSPVHYRGFNHAIIAIRLPDSVKDDSLVAVEQNPQLGRILFFDPTNELTPFGQIGGYLQANYGLLAAPSASALVRLPMQPPDTNGVRRSAKLTLDATGTLKGDVHETFLGDRAFHQRGSMLAVKDAKEQLKPIETLIAASVPSFQLTKADILNLHASEQPFGYNFAFEAVRYAKTAGNLLLVRPRVLGVKSSALLETKEPRRYPIEFSAPEQDTDEYEIALPPDYKVEELPAPVDADYSFASYHAKTVASGNTIRYTRSFQIKEVSVPVSKAGELKEFYRIIANDERSMAVLAK
jgi:hypothetical protein